MNQRIVFTQDGGATIAVVHPAPGVPIEEGVKSVPLGAQYKVIDVSDIPADRMFRDAWEMTVDETWFRKGLV